MKLFWPIMGIASLALALALAGCATHSGHQPGPSAGGLTPQQMLANMRATSRDAAATCGHFYDHSRRLQVRSLEMGKSLAAILRLRDAARKYHDAVSSEAWPRQDWLRECSDRLINAWNNVEVSIALLEPTPPVVGWWDRSQHSLVDLYRASYPYIGQPAGPLPTALASHSWAVDPVGVVRAQRVR